MTDAVVGGLVGALVGGAFVVIVAIAGFLIEGHRRRADASAARLNLQNQYIVESSADLSRRVRTVLREIRHMEPDVAFRSWEVLYDPIRQLEGELESNSPRYRLAGVASALDAITALLDDFLHQRVEVEGPLTQRGDMIATAASVEPETTKSDQDMREAIGYTGADLDELTRSYRSQSFVVLEEEIGSVLKQVAAYEPGPPLPVKPLLVTTTNEPFSRLRQMVHDWPAGKSS